jgi:CPA2 family monovalent cation:H+ antiporter-2
LHQHEFEAPKNIEKRKLQQLELNKEELIGKSISESHIREKNGMVVGIERNGKATTESESDLIYRKTIFYGWWVIKENEQIL